MQRQNQWFLPGDGIAREVIAANITRYLGLDALVRPGMGTGDYQGQHGYWITAYRMLSPSMIEDLKVDTVNWEQEQDNNQTWEVSYQDSNTYASRQYWGPSMQSGPYQASTDGKSAYTTGHAEHGYRTSQSGGARDPYSDPNSHYNASTVYGSTTMAQVDARPNAAPGYYTASDGNDYPISQQAQSSFTYGAEDSRRRHVTSVDKSRDRANRYHHSSMSHSSMSPGYTSVPNSSRFDDQPSASASRSISSQPYTSGPADPDVGSSDSAPPGYYLASDGRTYPLSSLDSKSKSRESRSYFSSSATKPPSQGEGKTRTEAKTQTPAQKESQSKLPNVSPAAIAMKDSRTKPKSAPTPPKEKKSGSITDNASKAGLGVSAAAGLIGLAALGRSALSSPTEAKPDPVVDTKKDTVVDKEKDTIADTKKTEPDSAPKPSIKPAAAEIPRPHSGGGYRRGFFN